LDTTGTSAQVAEITLGQHRHICAFFNSLDEHYRGLGSFIKDGFDRGDNAFHLVDPELREDHLSRLAKAGINVQEATERVPQQRARPRPKNSFAKPETSSE
jgi:hypothetical protein